MPNKKLTDNEIVKALECCCGDNGCFGCPYTENHSCRLLRNPIKDALDLINRQKAEIKRFQNGIEELNCKLDMANDSKVEAIKEFAERLKAEFLNDEQIVNMAWVNAINHIDNLVKETVGDA